MRGRRAQSEVIGVVLLLGLTVIGTTAIIAIGTTAISDSRQASEVQSTEHAMTLFDSRAGNVALGDADVQAVEFGRTDGRFDIEDGANGGTIRIEHRINGTVEWQHETPLGAVVYTNDGTKVAYQGGGVWRHENGGTGMVSPPEFHYHGETLTLPLIRVTGEGSASGEPELSVRSVNETARIYPTTGDPYPIEQGRVTVTVESEYYEGWKRYFETRTNGKITVDEAAKSVTVELQARETIGRFTMTGNGDEINLRGIDSNDAINEFTLTLWPNDPGGGESGRQFSPFQWGLEVSESDFELMFKKNGDYVDVMLTSPDGSETWEKTQAFAIQTDGDGNEYVDLELQPADPNDAGISLENGAGDTRPIGDLLGEYLFELGPDVDLEVFDQGQGGGGGSDRVDYDTSFGDLYYDSSDGFVAYLNITESEVAVRIS